MINETDVAGRKFRYRAGTRTSPRMTLRADHRLEGAPSIHEHSWEIVDGKLALFHRNGGKTAEFSTARNGRFAGVDLTAAPTGQAELIERKRGFFHHAAREFKYRFLGKKRPRIEPVSRNALLQNSIGLKLGGKTIRWVFQFSHDADYLAATLLPWAIPAHEKIAPETPADFLVGVYLDDQTTKAAFADLPGRKFLLSCEKETRFPRIENCHEFVQNPLPADDPAYTRYAPTFCQWSPPRSAEKTGKCSVVDNGQYVWRAEMIADLAKKIGGVEIFGKLSGKPLGGYHKSASSAGGNEKYLGIESFSFYLSLERAVASDYVTEKFTDAILCEAVPIYDGAPNIDDYALPGSYISAADIAQINWNDWKKEYAGRRCAVAAQKELLRTRLNLFSYFHRLTENLSLLDKLRPITRHG
jgi:hypothetical protein